MSRLFLYNADVQRITGKGKTAAQKLISIIKARFNKSRSEQITVEEFCSETKLSIDLVLQAIGWSRST